MPLSEVSLIQALERAALFAGDTTGACPINHYDDSLPCEPWDDWCSKECSEITDFCTCCEPCWLMWILLESGAPVCESKRAARQLLSRLREEVLTNSAQQVGDA